MKMIYLISKNQDFLESVQKNLIYISSSFYRFKCIEESEWLANRMTYLNPLNGNEAILILDGVKDVIDQHAETVKVYYFSEERSNKGNEIYKFQPVEAYINQIIREEGQVEKRSGYEGTQIVWAPMVFVQEHALESFEEALSALYKRGKSLCVVELLPFALKLDPSKTWQYSRKTSISDYASKFNQVGGSEGQDIAGQIWWVAGANHPVDLAVITPELIETICRSCRSKIDTIIILTTQFDRTWINWLAERSNYILLPNTNRRLLTDYNEKILEWSKLQNPRIEQISTLMEVQ